MYKREEDDGKQFNWEESRVNKTKELDKLMEERREGELLDFEETED